MFFKVDAAKMPALATPDAKAIGPWNKHTWEVVGKSLVIQSLKVEKAKNLEDVMAR